MRAYDVGLNLSIVLSISSIKNASSYKFPSLLLLDMIKRHSMSLVLSLRLCSYSQSSARMVGLAL